VCVCCVLCAACAVCLVCRVLPHGVGAGDGKRQETETDCFESNASSSDAFFSKKCPKRMRDREMSERGREKGEEIEGDGEKEARECVLLLSLSIPLSSCAPDT